MLEPLENVAVATAIRPLSPRETQVLEMVALGRTNGDIARRLSVTPHAVKFHLSSIYRKLGVTNRTEAAVVYLRLNADRPRAY